MALAGFRDDEGGSRQPSGVIGVKRSTKVAYALLAAVATLAAGCGSLQKQSAPVPKAHSVTTHPKKQPTPPAVTRVRCTAPSQVAYPNTWDGAKVVYVPWCDTVPDVSLPFEGSPNYGGYHVTIGQAINISANWSYKQLSRASTVYVQPIKIAFTWGGTAYNFSSAYIIVFSGSLGYQSSGPEPTASNNQTCAVVIDGSQATAQVHVFPVIGC